MFRQSGGGRRRISEVVAKFREKGATSPEKAMTAQEIGLPPRFEEAMKRRLGTTGIFVDVGGKYYLDEARLQQVEQQRATSGMMRGQQETRSGLLALRMVRMVVIAAALILVVANILFVDSASLRVIVVVLILLWVVLTGLQFYYISRLRNREYSSGFNETPS